MMTTKLKSPNFDGQMAQYTSTAKFAAIVLSVDHAIAKLKRRTKLDKPDATPREWILIPKVEYDALENRVAELESRSWICYTCGDGLKPLKKLMEIENLNKELADAEAKIEEYGQRIQERNEEIFSMSRELVAVRAAERMQADLLAAARQEIERLQHVINYDMPHPQLTQANARFETLLTKVEVCEGFMKCYEEREQKLVAALECVSMQDRTRGYPTGEEWMALVDKAFAALKAHTASAEKGGA